MKLRNVLAVFAIVIAGVIIWSFDGSLRRSIKWVAASSHLKKVVLDQPPTKDGSLKHVEWESWAFPGAGATTVYLAFDPSDALAGGTGSRRPVRPPGLPCKVFES